MIRTCPTCEVDFSVPSKSPTQRFCSNRCRRRPTPSLMERFMAKVDIQPNGCWRWIACVRPDGYGQIGNNNKGLLAHRASYNLFIGPIPDDRPILDHTCHDPLTCSGGKSCPHRRCVNPEHIVPSSKIENNSVERSCVSRTGQAARMRAQTKCKRGHVYTDETMVITGQGFRSCIICKKQMDRESYLRRSALRRV